MKALALALGPAVGLTLALSAGAADPAPAADPTPAPAQAVQAEAAPTAPAPVPAPEAAAQPEAQPHHRVALGPIGHDDAGVEGRIHTVVRGDTLWDISDAYLGTPWVWPSLWADNREIHNPDLIHPGDRLWITSTIMRPISEDEARKLMAAAPAVPASIGDAPNESAATRSIHFPSAERVGFVSAEEMAAATSVVEGLSSRTIFGQPDVIQIGLGAGEVQVGDQFTVFREQQDVFDPRSGLQIGSYVNVLGWGEVVSVHPETSEFRIHRADREIEVNDHVVRREKAPTDIALVPTRPGVEGQVVFTPNSRGWMGNMDVVFLDRGTEDGVRAGNSLEVYRPGYEVLDEVRDRRVHTADTILGEVVIVSARPTTSVGLITRAAPGGIERGDLVRTPPQP